MKKAQNAKVKNRKARRGFTLLEICVVAGFAGLVLLVAFLQNINIEAIKRDDKRKIALNAMYYALEEGYYAEKGYYPAEISDQNLTMMDPALFTDPNGVPVGSDGCDYIYIAADCNSEGKCKEYTLRSNMEKEDLYVKRNRSHQQQ